MVDARILIAAVGGKLREREFTARWDAGRALPPADKVALVSSSLIEIDYVA